MNYNKETRYWLNELDDAKRREKDFRDNGKNIKKLYDGEQPDEFPFNILYSNTETLSPALYSQLPRPAVKERFPKKDSKGFTQVNPLNKAVAEASNYMLSYLIDTNIEGYDKFHDTAKDVVLDALLPGRGVTAIQFDAKINDEKIEWASIVGNTKKYDRFFHGFGTKWEKVPWIAYEEYVDEDEAEDLFGAEIANKIKYTVSDEDEKNTKETEERRKTACIYQIWDKSSKTIKWISPAYTDYLREDDDPLGITGFFNTPKPLMLHRKSNDLMPTALYTLYENQAKELDRITRSINKVVQAIKVRGVYDGNLGDELERLMDSEDNVLIPTDKVSSLIDGGFDKHLWLLPLGELAGVLQQLYVAREQCKQVIYEITGISDILRGQSKASETLGAQKVKEAWGTMRLKNMQSDVQEYIRDILRIMLDVAVKNLPQSMWVKVTGLPYPTKKEKDRALKSINMLKPQIQQMMQGGDPKLKKLQKEAAELTEILSTPSWENILEVLKDDYIRSFKVDIETNSTLVAEATEDKKDISEGMNAMAQFMNGLMPMVEKQILPFAAAKSMLLDIVKRFRFGQEVEDEINAMTEPKGPNAEQAQEQQKKLAEEKKKLQQEQERFKEEQRKVGDKLDDQVNDLARQKMQLDMEKQVFEMKKTMEEELAVEKLKLMDAEMTADLQIKSVKAESKLKGMLEKSESKMQSIADRTLAGVEKAANKITESANADLRAEV